MEIFAAAARVRLQDVPCVGGAPSMAAMLGVHATNCAGSPAPSSPHVKVAKVLAPVAFQDAPDFQKFFEVDAQPGAVGCSDAAGSAIRG